MTEPRYILLTVKKITVPTSRGPAPSQSTMLNPVVRKLFPLPIAISMAQHGREAEVDAGGGMVLTMAEDFNDVLAALESAAAAGKYIVRPMQRGAIEAAVFPIGRTREQDIEDATKVVQAVSDEAEDFQSRVKEAVRAIGGARHQDERWDDFPVPGVRDVTAGDLRIVELDTPGRFWIEMCVRDFEDESDKEIFEWTRVGVPGDLLAVHETREAARQAVKLAGYVRRLVEA